MPSMIFQSAVDLAVDEKFGDPKKLLLDIHRIGARRAPNILDLRYAPFLDHWLPVIRNEGSIVSLAGLVHNHPIRSNGLIVTSMLCAIEAETFTWARTASRWYRLGKHFGRFEISGREI